MQKWFIIFQNVQKWLINVGEEPDARNATLDTGTSLGQISINLSLVFAAIKNQSNAQDVWRWRENMWLAMMELLPLGYHYIRK